MENKYCNLVGTNKIKDEYTKINTGFDRVETDIDALNDLIDTLKNSGVDIYNNIVEAREDIAEINELLGDDELETEAQTITGAINELKRGKRVARFTIGTTQNGWTAGEVDYLCDGVDDQVEIIQALDALPETGGEVVILDGIYNITASINIPKNNVSLRGNGNATILKRGYNSTDTDRGLITLFQKSGCKIQGLQIDGNKATYTDLNYNNGIRLYSSSNNMVTGNTCNNNNHSGIELYLSSDNTVAGNTCNNNNHCGIWSYGPKFNTIIGNTCNNNSYGIELYSSSETTVTGNTCYKNNSFGISLYVSSDNTITGNTCTNNNYGIGLYESSNNNTVTGNTCYKNNSYGIYLSRYSDNNTITGNTCYKNKFGIYLHSPSYNYLFNNNNTITGNTCNNNNSYGIYLYASKNSTITSNTCNNNNNGIGLHSSSNNNTVTGNTCNNTNCGIRLSSSSNNTITGNTCIRGTGTPGDYTTDQYTIYLSSTDNNYNLISFNNCMGKAVEVKGGTGNSVWGNKFDATDDLP